MSKRTVERITSTVDTRLPRDKFMQITMDQATAMPLEIVENGVRYRATDGRVVSKGSSLCFLATYTEIKEEGKSE